MVKDREGKTTSVLLARRIVDSFDVRTVNGYLSMFDRLCAASLEQYTPSEAELAATTAVLLLNNEMFNTLRTGQPPTVPSYSRAALWRGEDVCLSELTTGDLKV